MGDFKRRAPLLPSRSPNLVTTSAMMTVPELELLLHQETLQGLRDLSREATGRQRRRLEGELRRQRLGCSLASSWGPRSTALAGRSPQLTACREQVRKGGPCHQSGSDSHGRYVTSKRTWSRTNSRVAP